MAIYRFFLQNGGRPPSWICCVHALDMFTHELELTCGLLHSANSYDLEWLTEDIHLSQAFSNGIFLIVYTVGDKIWTNLERPAILLQ